MSRHKAQPAEVGSRTNGLSSNDDARRIEMTVETRTNVDMIDALETNFWSMWRQFGRGHRCRLVEDEDVTRFETPITRLPYNAVIRFIAEDEIERRIARALAPYARRRVPVMWVLHPTTTDDLARRLAVHGLTAIETIPGMFRQLDDLPTARPLSDGVVITEVDQGTPRPYIDLVADRYRLTPKESTTLGSIWKAARFGAPDSPNRSWIATRHGTPLAKVTTHRDGDIAGIYGVATTPDARRMGLGRALTLHALTATRDVGAQAAVLHSSAMATSLYRALGFEQIAEFRLLSRPGALRL
jgi:ribosomal protein S18 acetylase RimI-like enzyme